MRDAVPDRVDDNNHCIQSIDPLIENEELLNAILEQMAKKEFGNISAKTNMQMDKTVSEK